MLSATEAHKVQPAIDLARDVLASGHRPLILTTRRETADAIGLALNCPVGHGDTSPDKRRDVLLSGDGAAVSTIFAVTTGIDLVEFDTVIFVGLDWVPSRILQAEARAHRIGQLRSVTVYFLIGRGTIDEVVRERVIERLDVFSIIVGGGRGDEAELSDDLQGESEDDLIASIVRRAKEAA
jgi:superfamily II DNA or RNA helicase